jgi:hypothetical protein
VTLPQEHFDLIERAAVSKPPRRIMNPRFVGEVISQPFAEPSGYSKGWGLDYDIFA